MTQPQPLNKFKDQLLQSEIILTFISEMYGDEAESKIAQWRSGDAAALYDLIEEYKTEFSGPEYTMDALDSYNSIFQIEVWCTGPVFWIRAYEDEDTDYFSSLDDACRYAEKEFEGPLALFEQGDEHFPE